MMLVQFGAERPGQRGMEPLGFGDGRAERRRRIEPGKEERARIVPIAVSLDDLGAG